MPDRYDPKLSVRPSGERKAAETPADGDPLAELARIVSGRPPSDSLNARDGDGADSSPDIERDLEAELLNDLQASFAALSGPLEAEGAQPDAGDAEAPASPAPLPPSPFEMAPPPATAARAPAAKTEPEQPDPAPRKEPDPFSFDINQAFDEAEAAAAKVVREEQARRTEPRVPRPYAPPMRGPASLAGRNAETVPRSESSAASESAAPPETAAAETRGRPPAPSRVEPVPPRPVAPERPAARRPAPRPPARGERPNIPVRPLPMDDDDHVPEAAAPRRAPPPARPAKAEPAPALPSRFAPQRAAALPPAAPPPPLRRPAQPEPQADALDEDFAFELGDLHAEADGPFEDEFTLDDLDMGAYDADGEFPPFPEEETGRRRRSSRVVAVIAGMLAVVAVGGTAVFLYRGDAASDGPPPIIAAEQGPLKIPPEPSGTGTETDSQSKLIYDRVGESGEGGDTRLVTGESQIGSIPADDGADADNPISRVIIPGGPGIDRPVTGDDAGGTALADGGVPEDDGQSDIGPRMVRTVVVKPDGTIVSSEATGVDENGNALPGTEDDVAMAEPLMPEAPRSEMDAILDGGDLAVNADPLSDPGARTEPSAASEAPDPLPGTAAAEIPDLPSPEPAPPAATASEPAPAPAPPPPRQETQVAARNGNGPIDLTPGTAPAGGPAPSAGGVLVQVAAQRSEEAAVSSYRDLQRRYPSILGSFQPRIVRADLGAKGVYYRVRIGPFEGNDATRLCNDLKAAGGDCLLAR